jgi:hypothetical protein
MWSVYLARHTKTGFVSDKLTGCAAAATPREKITDKQVLQSYITDQLQVLKTALST